MFTFALKERLKDLSVALGCLPFEVKPFSAAMLVFRQTGARMTLSSLCVWSAFAVAFSSLLPSISGLLV